MKKYLALLLLLLTLVPVIAGFVLLREPIVHLLYSDEFTPILPFISWGMMGIIFRAVSWSMAFVILAKGSGKVYLLTETMSAVTGLALNIIFYEQWGLVGLGWAFTVWYVVYTIIIAVVYCSTYGLRLARMSLVVLAWSVAVTLGIVYSCQSDCIPAAIAIAVVSTAANGYMLVKQWKR